jgi:hypothetical protein
VCATAGVLGSAEEHGVVVGEPTTPVGDGRGYWAAVRIVVGVEARRCAQAREERRTYPVSASAAAVRSTALFTDSARRLAETSRTLVGLVALRQRRYE